MKNYKKKIITATMLLFFMTILGKTDKIAFSSSAMAASIQSYTNAGKMIARAEKEAYKKKKKVTVTVSVKEGKTSDEKLERAVTKAELGVAYYNSNSLNNCYTACSIGGFTGGLYFYYTAMENYRFDAPPFYEYIETNTKGKLKMTVKNTYSSILTKKNGIDTYQITILGNKKNYRNAYYRNLCLKKNISELRKKVKGMGQKKMAATVAEWIASRRPDGGDEMIMIGATDYENINDGYSGAWGAGRDYDILIRNKKLSITSRGLDTRLYVIYAKLAGVKNVGLVVKGIGKNPELSAYVQCGNKKYIVDIYDTYSYEKMKKETERNLKNEKARYETELEQNQKNFEEALTEALEDDEDFDLSQNQDLNEDFINLTEEEIDQLRTEYKQKIEETLLKEMEEKNKISAQYYEKDIQDAENQLKVEFIDYWLQAFPKSNYRIYKNR